MVRCALPPLLFAACFSTAVAAEDITVGTSQDVMIGARAVPVDLALRLMDIGPTRISIESVLDLRPVQEALVAELTRTTFVDTCIAEISVTDALAEADDTALTLGGRIEAKVFRCRDRDTGTPERGRQLFDGSIIVGAAASAEYRNDCLHFRLLDLKLTPERLAERAEESDAIERVRDIFFEKTDTLLQNNPVCPGLPPELASLKPSYDAGGTQELGDGGIGLTFRGSIDASTETIIDILQVLQRKGVLPPPPD